MHTGLAYQVVILGYTQLHCLDEITIDDVDEMMMVSRAWNDAERRRAKMQKD